MTEAPTCPVCTRVFANAKGRGGHLSTFNDAAHASYRQAHGMKAPLGPDHKPTKAGARVRGGRNRDARSASPPPTDTAPSPARDAAPSEARANLQRALQELAQKALEANHAREEQRAAERAWVAAPESAPSTAEAPSTPEAKPGRRPTPSYAAREPSPRTPVEPPSTPSIEQTPSPAPASKVPGEKWLVAGGAAAAGIGLAALVKNLKGANAPKHEEVPEGPPPGRPPMSIPDGIWANPETRPPTTGNEWLDQQLGYSGGIKHRRHTL